MIELLRERRSVRKYLEKQIEPEKIEILKEALLRSPSSKNINPWEFIFVNNPEIIEALKNCRPHGTIALQSASLAVVICADETKNDVWVEDCSIASIILQLTATSLGLGSCWIQVRNREHSETISTEKYIRDLLKVPDNFRILNIITIGYAGQSVEGEKIRELQTEKIRFNQF